MNSHVVRTFLSLDNEENESKVPQELQKSMKRLNNILNKSSTSSSKQTLLEVQIVNQTTNQVMCKMDQVSNAATISAIKDVIERKYPQFYKSRQSLSLSASESQLKDYDTLADFNLANECILYFQDLGPQIRWPTVFHFQYLGPLLLYFVFFVRPPFVYEADFTFRIGSEFAVQLAAGCHAFHYLRRLLETRYIHRFSQGALPVTDLVINTLYYWTFGAWMSYFINHPQYTPPFFGTSQIYAGLGMFTIGEVGNFSIHLALNSVSVAGNLKRQTVHPTKNPFTWLFTLVSCPNYTYELLTWMGFAIMTQTIVALFFVAVGFFQMARWAVTRHRNYQRRIPDYPKSRKAVLPFML